MREWIRKKESQRTNEDRHSKRAEDENEKSEFVYSARLVTTASDRFHAGANFAAPKVVLIKAGRLIDVRAGRVLENQGILVEGQRIKAVGPFTEIQRGAPASATVIDLSQPPYFPGLQIATRTFCFKVTSLRRNMTSKF